MGCDCQLKVADFCVKATEFHTDKPAIPSYKIRDLRISLMQEEFDELVESMYNGDMSGIAKELTDLIYVVLGTSIVYGIDLAPIFNVVHESNMKKIGGSRRFDGKVLKPEGWRAPDINQLLIEQGWLP